MNDLELAEEIEKQLKGCDNDTLAWPSVALTPDEWDKIIAALRRGHEREGFYEKLWKDFVSLQRGDAQGILAKVEAYYRERPPSGEMVMVPRDAWEGFVRMLQKHQGHKDRGDITPQRILELARAMIAAAEAEGRKG